MRIELDINPTEASELLYFVDEWPARRDQVQQTGPRNNDRDLTFSQAGGSRNAAQSICEKLRAAVYAAECRKALGHAFDTSVFPSTEHVMRSIRILQQGMRDMRKQEPQP